MQGQKEGSSSMQLYTRVGFGLLILLGWVGNCVSHKNQTGPIAFIVCTTITWCTVRIMYEALEALHVLRDRKK
jgi:hypothetical protein